MSQRLTAETLLRIIAQRQTIETQLFTTLNFAVGNRWMHTQRTLEIAMDQRIALRMPAQHHN